ncbi:MAG: BsuPI-related putative proteinase inhibitor [Candidatus Thermochlorobacter sp.]
MRNLNTFGQRFSIFLTVLVTVLLLFCFMTGCERFETPVSNAGVITRGGVDFSLTLRRSELPLGDTLSGSFTVMNRSGAVQRFNFRTSCQLGLRLSSNERIWIELPEMCAQVLTSFELRPSESRTIVFQLPLRHHRTGEFLPHGDYALEAFLLDDNSPVLRQSVRVQ